MPSNAITLHYWYEKLVDIFAFLSADDITLPNLALFVLNSELLVYGLIR